MSSPRRCDDTTCRARAPRHSAWGLVLVSLTLSSFADAAPYAPSSDETVLEKVAGGAQLRQFQSLRRELASNPGDVDAALKLSRAYLDAGRRNSDPRFISYAQATLAPWIQRPNARADILVLGAIVLQSSHRFDESLVLLDKALRMEPRNSQALLTKATVLQVRGNFDAARRTCAQLIGTTDQMVALACVASANAMNGRLPASHAALERALRDNAHQTPEIRSWLLGQLGEMSVRLGDTVAAERYFKAALAVDSGDLYVKGEYADLLLRQQRASDVIALLKDHEAQDALLLRLSQAGLSLKTPQGWRWSEMCAARYEAARRDGDATHLREQARYELDVRGNAFAALQLAQRNWQSQREPADIRIYLRAATTARNSQALSHIMEWIDRNGYQDRTLSADASPASRS